MKKVDTKTIQLSWEPVLDSLEYSAVPSYYKLYKRIGNSGFDNGKIVFGTTVNVDIDDL